MKRSGFSILALCAAGVLGLTTLAQAQVPAKPAAPAPAKPAAPAAAKPAAATTGQTVMSSVTVTATVTAINQQTRAVTLTGQNGQVYSFVADSAVKNLAQVKKGDNVTVTYVEALAYDVRKPGAAPAPTTTVAGAAAPVGAKPAGAIAQQTTATVTITAIDPKVPSVTFKGPQGNTQTIKVLHPERLQGVKVGDMVDLTYTQALAIKVTEAPKPAPAAAPAAAPAPKK
jgi:hypothetical protein